MTAFLRSYQSTLEANLRQHVTLEVQRTTDGYLARSNSPPPELPSTFQISHPVEHRTQPARNIAAASDEHSTSAIRFGTYNSTGLRVNFDTLLTVFAAFDVLCLQELFWSSSSASQLRWPHEWHVTLSDAKRNFRSGRAGGGTGILIRRSSSLELPRTVFLSPVMTAVLCRLKGFSRPLLVVSVYRAPPTSPAYEPEIFIQVSDLSLSYPEHLQFFAGDFNVKLGSWDGYDEETLSEIQTCVPQSALKPIPDSAGIELATVMADLGFAVVYPRGDDGTALPTFFTKKGLLSERGEVISFGSALLDFAFCDSELFSRLLDCQLADEPESGHAAIVFIISTESAVPTDEGPSSDGTSISRRIFNPVKALDLFAPPHLDHLTSPSGSVSDALAIVTALIESVTDEWIPRDRRTPYEDQVMLDFRRQSRRLSKLLRTAQSSEEADAIFCRRELVLRAWRERRDCVASVRKSKIVKAFWTARTTGDPKRMWTLMKRDLSGKGGGVQPADTKWVPREVWEPHFSAIFFSAAKRGVPLNVSTQVSDRFLDDDFSAEEVEVALEGKKNHKATGPDGLPIDALRVFRYEPRVTRAVAALLSRVYRFGVPDEWTRSYMIVLKKPSGALTDPNAYRGICLSSHLKKLFESCLANRLRIWTDERDSIPGIQAAFRPQSSASEHIYVLEVLRHQAIFDQQAVFVILVDLTKAFPSVERQRLIDRLMEVGLSRKFVLALADMYSRDEFSIVLDGQAGPYQEANEGTQEGSVLSPPCFSLVIAPLQGNIQEASTDPPSIGSTEIRTLLFADDILGCSRSQDGLQEYADRVSLFCRQNRLRVNARKCEVLAFNTNSLVREAFSVSIEGTVLCVQDSARYLCVHFSLVGDWKAQADQLFVRISSAVGRCKVMCSLLGNTSVKDYLNVFDSVVTSIFRFGLGVWGWQAPKLFKPWDISVVAGFIRWAGRLPKSTCEMLVLAECGRSCAVCESLFQAACDVCRALATHRPSSPWRQIVEEQRYGDNPFFVSLRARFQERGFLDLIFDSPAEFLARRKTIQAEFAKFCARSHLLRLRDTSTDDVIQSFSFESRFLFLNRAKYFPRLYPSDSTRGRDHLCCWESGWTGS